MRKTGAYTVGLAAQKLFTNSTTYPQVAFDMLCLGTNIVVSRSLYKLAAQFCTQYISGFNSLSYKLMTTIHRPNNDYNKGE